MLEPLSLIERRLHPEVGGSRQNAFRESQDAFHVEFFELAGVTVDPNDLHFTGCSRRLRIAPVDRDGSSMRANPGGTPRARVLFPLRVPPLEALSTQRSLNTYTAVANKT